MDSIIESIILADEQARSVFNEAKHNKDIADITLKDNEKRIVDDYKAKAAKELKEYRISKERAASNTIESIEIEFQDAMREIEKSENENISRWVTEITENVVSALSHD